MDPLQYLAVGAAGVAAGLVNALAGGGTLITFPTLTTLGIPSVPANVTNTVALAPGHLGAVLAQYADLSGQKRRLWILLPPALVGGILGGILLLHTQERLFRMVVPFLILLGSLLLAIQDVVKRYLQEKNSGAEADSKRELWSVLPVAIACVYGGYFGAGLSVILLAVLGLFLDDTLTRLNALKQALSFAANIATAALFVFSGKVVWQLAAVMAAGAILGGVLGGKLAGRIPSNLLRWLVVTIGVVVALLYWI